MVQPTTINNSNNVYSDAMLGCMLKVIRAQSRSHFVCSRFTRRLYYYRRLLYVKYKKTSSFNSIFLPRSSVAEIVAPPNATEK